jgi:ribosomal peptide maturation radical SAM protein 1
MPWASNNRPSLAVGTLVSLAKRNGFPCGAFYPTFDLAAVIGDAYESLAEDPHFFGVCEHLFAASAFGKLELNSEEFLATYADGEVNPFLRLRDEVIPPFVTHVVGRILQRKPDIVGFSCTFNQVYSSLAVAKVLKERAPHLTVLMGGACVHGPMGEAYARAFPEWLDHVFTGEADETFVPFLRQWPNGSQRVGGVTYGGVLQERAIAAPRCFADPCVPDFADWFTERAQSAGAATRTTEVSIPFESSRGCWWGEKSHCTFCGLNNEGMSFRRKTAERTVAELLEQATRHQNVSFMAADNILDHRAFTDLLPEIASLGYDLRLFYEIKANVDRDRIATLARAGVRWVQPGIESFSSHVLQLMRKGITGLQNIAFLRLASEYGIATSYNILVGFPGEQDEDYEALIHAMSTIFHLSPPSGSSTLVQVHRFSPFFMEPERHGIENLRPSSYYNHLLPLQAGARQDFAYFFERDVPADAAVLRWQKRVDDVIVKWASRFGRQRKTARLGPGFVEISVTNDGNESHITLDGLSSTVVLLADNVTSFQAICRQVENLVGAGPAQDEVRDAIDNLVSLGVLAEEDGKLVSIVPYEQPKSSQELHGWLRAHGASSAIRGPRARNSPATATGAIDASWIGSPAA